MQIQMNKSSALKQNLVEINKLRDEVTLIPVLSRIEKEMALYEIISRVESLPLTVREKASLAGITERKYQYSRRVIRDFPTSESIRKHMQEHGAFSIMNYKTQVFKPKKDLKYKFYSWLNRNNITYSNPEFIEMVKCIYAKIVLEVPFVKDKYFEYQPCLTCGELANDSHVIKIRDGVTYKQCQTCIDDEMIPTDKQLLDMVVAYSNNIYSSYIKAMELL